MEVFEGKESVEKVCGSVWERVESFRLRSARVGEPLVKEARANGKSG